MGSNEIRNGDVDKMDSDKDRMGTASLSLLQARLLHSCLCRLGECLSNIYASDPSRH